MVLILYIRLLAFMKVINRFRVVGVTYQGDISIERTFGIVEEHEYLYTWLHPLDLHLVASVFVFSF